jgi:quercetin dioxygenase-like cupin family protein
MMNMSVKHMQDVAEEPIETGDGVKKQVLITADEGPHFAMRRFVIQPGGSMPKHTNLVEHEQFVLAGKARIGIGDEVYEVGRDDVVFIPANIAHWYKNIGEEPFAFLCLVPNQPDRTTILE